jgi:hypothetical protein
MESMKNAHEQSSMCAMVIALYLWCVQHQRSILECGKLAEVQPPLHFGRLAGGYVDGEAGGAYTGGAGGDYEERRGAVDGW